MFYIKELLFNFSNKKVPLIISDNINKSLNRLLNIFDLKNVVIITDENISCLHLEKIIKYLKKYISKINTLILPAGEKFKSLDSLKKIIDILISNYCDRDTTIFAFGGGVICDIASFAASIYLRGIKLVNIPTTLLSQVDAAIGGKTAINYNSNKNILGSFYYPNAIIINVKYLLTLPKREFSSGLSEIIKYAIISGNIFFNWLNKNLEKIINLNFKYIMYCIKYCHSTKMIFVNNDKFDHKNRNILNFGHTFGHAIESYTQYNCTWLHGEAISAGMMKAINVSINLKKLNKSYRFKIKNLIERANLPTDGPVNMNNQDYYSYLIRDKKLISGKLNFVILSDIGKAEIYKIDLVRLLSIVD